MKLSKLKNVFKRFALMFAISASITGTVVGVYVDANTVNNNSKYKPVTASNFTFDGYAAPTTPLPILKTGHTPSTLLTVPTIPDPSKTGDIVQAVTIIQGLSRQGWLDNTIAAKYEQAVKDLLWFNTIHGGTGIKENVPLVQQAVRTFTDKEVVSALVNKINQFKNVDGNDKLLITRPEHIYEYLSTAKADLAGSEIPINGASPKPFSYKVASLLLKDIPKNKNIIFKVKNLNDPKNADHNYSLVFNNQTGDLNSKLTPKSKTAKPATITDLINQRYIFVRDEKDTQVYDQTLTNTLKPLDFLKLDFDAQRGAINIYVSPEGKTDATGVEFALSNETKPFKSKIQYGILDHTYSPRHLKAISAYNVLKLPSSWHADPLDSADQLSSKMDSPFVFNLSAKWNQEKNFKYRTTNFDSVNHLRFFMAKGAGKIEFTLKFNNKSADAFKDSNNKLTIKFDASGIKPQLKSKLTITKDEYNKVTRTISPIGISLNKLLVDKWLQVDLFFQAGIISIAPDPLNPKNETNFILKSTSSRIFFEPPVGVNLPNGKTTGADIVNIERAIKLGSFNKVLIGRVFASWSNPKAMLSQSPDKIIKPNKTWFPDSPKEKKMITSNGEATFDVNFDMWHINKDKKFILDGAKNAILKDMKDNNVKGKTIIKQNPSTGEVVLDSTGKPIYLPATGANVISQLELISKLYDQWTRILDPNQKESSPRESYIIQDVNTATGMASKMIIGQSGKYGSTVESVVSEALTRTFEGIGQTTATQDKWLKAFGIWESGNYASLTKEQNEILKPLLVTYGNHKPWTNVLSDFKDVGKPVKGKAPATDQKFKDGVQYMMWVIAPYLMDSVNQIFKNEQSHFKVVKSKLLGEYMGTVLSQTESTNSITAVTSKVIQSIPNSSLPTQLKGIKLLQLSGSPTYKVNSIKKALDSLLKFITDTGLQDRYLSEKDTKDFNDYYSQHSLTDEKIYKDLSQQFTVVSMVGLLDKIISKVVNGRQVKGIYTFEQIINRIIGGQDQPDAVKKNLNNTIAKTIETIAKPTKSFKYSYFGGEAYSSYIENLVIGSNVKNVVTKWVKDKEAEMKKDSGLSYLAKTENFSTVKDIISGDALYNEDTLTRIAINTGNYNLNYFIKSFWKKGYIIQAAMDLYNSDIGHSVSFDLPRGNSLAKMISNPSAFTKYILPLIGLIILLTGIFALTISFRSAVKTNQSKKSILIIRSTCLVMAIGGIGLLCLGIIVMI